MVNHLSNVYKDSCVLITGHTGFKGGWLSLWLSMLGTQVIGYSLEAPSQPSFFQATDLATKIKHIHGDIRDVGHLKSIFEKYQPTFVFHLAAQPLVLFSYKEPHLTYETNIMGTVNVLEAIRNAESVRAALIITSDKCYENKEMIWGYRENDPVGGQDPYSSSKGCAELITSAYLRSYFPPDKYGSEHKVALASVRSGNVIGGGDWGADRLVPDCVRALSKGESIIIRKPRAIRPWQYVLDSLFGYLVLGSKLSYNGCQFSGAWNFGPMNNQVWCVEDLVKEVIRLWGEGSYVVDTNYNPRETHWLKLDCSKADIELGWHPTYSVTTALKKTVMWYKEYYRGADVARLRDYSEQQIREYFEF